MNPAASKAVYGYEYNRSTEELLIVWRKPDGSRGVSTTYEKVLVAEYTDMISSTSLGNYVRTQIIPNHPVKR